MSLATMTRGSVVELQRNVQVQNDSFEYVDGFATIATLECNLQCNSSDVGNLSDQYRRYTAFFAADPGVPLGTDYPGYRLRVTNWDGTPVDQYLLVRGSFQEGRPGRALLWVLECEERTGRRDANY